MRTLGIVATALQIGPDARQLIPLAGIIQAIEDWLVALGIDNTLQLHQLRSVARDGEQNILANAVGSHDQTWQFVIIVKQNNWPGTESSAHHGHAPMSLCT